MRTAIAAVTFFAALDALASIPATPVLTLYSFNGPSEMPYYAADDILSQGTAAAPAGTLAQGSALIPCLVIRDGAPLTDARGTPYVGFEVLIDPRTATRDSTAAFKAAVVARQGLEVQNHHCAPDVQRVVSAAQLYRIGKAPFFDPPPAEQATPATAPTGGSELDRLVRAFHASPECAAANQSLAGRRAALDGAWGAFIRARSDVTPSERLERARHLDHVLRTALYEGHLGRGCNAYGACERNVIVLSIRNRALERCRANQGCGYPGDFQGVASMVSQYNIWDELLTQVSGLTSCFLRPDLANDPHYAKLQAMYAQSEPDAERILFGGDAGLRAVFPANGLDALRSLRHYYHAPAMGKCFPEHARVEYISAVVARRGDDFALLANTRIEVGERNGDGYPFREFLVEETAERDLIRVADAYPGFLVDARKVALRPPVACPPFGIPPGCSLTEVGRYRRVPNWLATGMPLGIVCPVTARGETCLDPAQRRVVEVGGTCDREMRPVGGVP